MINRLAWQAGTITRWGAIRAPWPVLRIAAALLICGGVGWAAYVLSA